MFVEKSERDNTQRLLTQSLLARKRNLQSRARKVCSKSLLRQFTNRHRDARPNPIRSDSPDQRQRVFREQKFPTQKQKVCQVRLTLPRNNLGKPQNKQLPSRTPKALDRLYSIVPPFFKFPEIIDAPIYKIGLHKFSKNTSRGTTPRPKVKPPESNRRPYDPIQKNLPDFA